MLWELDVTLIDKADAFLSGFSKLDVREAWYLDRWVRRNQPVLDGVVEADREEP